jgi:hypothetical protein
VPKAKRLGRRHSRSAERELWRRERETRDNLAGFVKSVATIAAELASNPQTGGEERSLIHRHGDHFSRSVADLTAMLADHPHSPDREFRLFQLWQALGSATLIANRWTERIEKRVKIESAARATAAKKAASERIDEVLVAAAKPIWRQHPKRTPYWVAGQICEQVQHRLPRPLGRPAISKRLGRLRSRILSTD